MFRRACAAYLGALVSLSSPVPLSGEPSPAPVSAGHSLRSAGARPSRAALRSSKGGEGRAEGGGQSAALGPAAGERGATAESAAGDVQGVAAGGSAPGGEGRALAEVEPGPLAEGSPALGLEAWPENPVTLVNVHSNEALALDEHNPSDERFSRLMPDRTSGEMRGFDPRLLGVLRRIAARHPGARIELVSGYRSPKFNEHLRKKGHRVASHSEHSLGHALDFRVEGLTPAQVVAEVRAQGWVGGIGRYDGTSDRFVHVDVGRNRFWMGR